MPYHPIRHQLLLYEAEQSRAQLDALQIDMAVFERQYGMTADEFSRRYQAGQTDDRMDFVEWYSLIRMRDNLRSRLQVLMGERGT